MARNKKDYSIPLEEGIDLYNSAFHGAVDQLREDGFDLDSLLSKPIADGGEFIDCRLPFNTHSLGSRDLGELLNNQSIYHDYIEMKLSVARAALLNADEKLKLAKAKVRKSKIGTVQEKDDESIQDGRYAEINSQWVQAKTYEYLLSALETSCKKNIATISRLIAVREQQHERGTRVSNVQNKRSRKPRLG